MWMIGVFINNDIWADSRNCYNVNDTYFFAEQVEEKPRPPEPEDTARKKSRGAEPLTSSSGWRGNLTSAIELQHKWEVKARCLKRTTQPGAHVFIQSLLSLKKIFFYSATWIRTNNRSTFPRQNIHSQVVQTQQLDKTDVCVCASAIVWKGQIQKMLSAHTLNSTKKKLSSNTHAHRVAPPPPILLHTVAGSCPDIRRAPEKRKKTERVNREGWVVSEGVGGGGGDDGGDGIGRLHTGVNRSLWAAGFEASQSHSSVKLCESEPSCCRPETRFTVNIWTRAEPGEEKKKKRPTAGGLKMLARGMFLLLGLSWTCGGESVTLFSTDLSFCFIVLIQIQGVESSSRIQGVESSSRIQGVESSSRIQGVESSSRIQGVESSDMFAPQTVLNSLLLFLRTFKEARTHVLRIFTSHNSWIFF